MGKKIVDFAITRPKLVMFLALLFTALTLLRIGTLTADTDPENMLDPDNAVRVFHNQVKKDFDLSDMVILGVVNEDHPDGVFNVETLGKIHRITMGAREIEGVVKRDVMAPSTVDDIVQSGLGSVSFSYLMKAPPASQQEALHMRERSMANPLLQGTLVSEDGRALALYVPIESKEIAHRVSLELQALIDAEPAGAEDYHITGLPVAEDTFGVEMFMQMGLSAPLAGLVVLLLMLWFFKKPVLVISPMVVAMLTVLMTMGLLISMGFTLHIMSSMIPIFLMPIAVVDSVHILSVFFDRYQSFNDRAKTLRAVMDELFVPMLYTTITTMAGFASLALTPIPPVRVFGAFVALGVGLAWLLTITVVPAYIMLFISEEKLKNFGTTEGDEDSHGLLARVVRTFGRLTRGHAKAWLVATVFVMAGSAYGITLISINDNPVNWFSKDHPIRVADRVLNEHFGGTYGAYLVLEAPAGAAAVQKTHDKLEAFLGAKAKAAGQAGAEEVAETVRLLEERLGQLLADSLKEANPLQLVEGLLVALELRVEQLDSADDDVLDALDLIYEGLEEQRLAMHLFKSPELLRRVETLQAQMAQDQLVGKSNSLADMVKKVYMELMEGRPEHFRIPDSPAAVAQSILSFQSSHDPDDVFHLVTPDYRRLNIWVQLKSGDNRDMEAVVASINGYLEENPMPEGITHSWAGLTYINIVWQDNMVTGMLNSLLGSFAIVLVLMSVLFRSVSWGVISMVPLSVTIAFIYGVIGLVGKDYDMPVAVLSSLTLGMSIDFAIHYIQRARELVKEKGSWAAASREMAEAPGRAISRNAVVIAVGFTPLLFAGLIPYRTVGILLGGIMAVSGVGTLIILPSLIEVGQKFLFKTPTPSGSQEGQV